MRFGTGNREEVVEVDLEMLKVMERISDFNLGAPNPKTLANLRMVTKRASE